MTLKKLVPVLLIGLFACVSVLAQSQKSSMPDVGDASRKGDVARLAQQKSMEKFDAADEDKNGVLSRAEVAKHFPFFDQNFARYDLDKDGVLNWDEFVGHTRWKREAK